MNSPDTTVIDSVSTETTDPALRALLDSELILVGGGEASICYFG